MKTFHIIQVHLLLILIIYIPLSLFSQSDNIETNTQTLLERLDSNFKASTLPHTHETASSRKGLLEYYRSRTSVVHPESTNKKPPVSDKDLKYANDALKHIFVGQPAYPSHFCGDDINWNSRPVPDNEWVWQLNRMYFWNSMGKVYANTNDERYAEAWSHQIVDWIIKNPNDDAHKHAWRSIEAGIRGQSWTSQYYHFLQSEHFTPEVLITFMNSCYDHAEYLMNKYRSGSNWALMEAEGLAFIAFIFPEFKNSDDWKKEAIRRFNIEINNQVYPDGQQRELSMGYHIGSIRWFYRTYELAMLNEQEKLFPPSFFKQLENMSEVPMKICLPDGTNAQFGDSWAGSAGQYNSKFLEWSELYDREDFLFMGSGGKKGQEPKQTAYALENSGLYSMRSDWSKDATCLVLKCGPEAGGHGQPDNGTFTLYAGGRTLMPDAGSYIYHGDPEWRNWFRQTKVHQTLTLNGEDTQYNPSQLKWETSDDLDLLVIENTGYSDLTHRRSVFFIDKSYFVIVDEATGTGIGNVDIHFQLAPGKAVYNQDDFSVHSDHKEGWNVLIRTNKQKDLELNEEEGWVSFVYTKKEPRPAFQYRVKKDDPKETVRFITLVAPYEYEIPDIKIDLENTQDGFNLVLQENGQQRIISN